MFSLIAEVTCATSLVVSNILVEVIILSLTGSTKVLSESQLVDLWETIDARVGELLEGCEPLPPPPLTFNPASEIPLEEQKLVDKHMTHTCSDRLTHDDYLFPSLLFLPPPLACV